MPFSTLIAFHGKWIVPKVTPVGEFFFWWIIIKVTFRKTVTVNAAYLTNIITILIRGWIGLGISVMYKYATLYHMLWSCPSLSLSFPPFLPPNLHTCRRPKDLLCLGLFLVFIILWAAIGIYGRYITLCWMATISGYRRGIPYCYCPLFHVVMVPCMLC